MHPRQTSECLLASAGARQKTDPTAPTCTALHCMALFRAQCDQPFMKQDIQHSPAQHGNVQLPGQCHGSPHPDTNLTEISAISPKVPGSMQHAASHSHPHPHLHFETQSQACTTPRHVLAPSHS